MRDCGVDLTLAMQRAQLSGWGRYPWAECAVSEPSGLRQLIELLPGSASLIARGNGRSYGDSSLNPAQVVKMRRLDHMLSFDGTQGVLTCEAGTLLSDIVDALLPRGWFPAVTPGTKQVTIGGLIAADVHGKNHHAVGSFCDHVVSLDLLLADGRIVTCSKEENAALFAATCGGMGLTGVIIRATIRMLAVETAKIRLRTVPAANLDEAIAVFESSLDVTYSVAWIDCLAPEARLGRSIVFLGNHARISDLPAAERATPFARAHRMSKTLPINFPTFVLSRPAVQLFNAAYFWAHKAGASLVDFDPYFYPLDVVQDWNRMYGRRGFVQYQSLLPLAESRDGLKRLLAEIGRSGQASLLAVLKRMGPQSFGMMSFPCRGYTLALDFPATAHNLALLDRLDAIIREHGGRVYLAKDARTSPAMVEAGYPRLTEFRDLRHRFGMTGHFASLQSQRLEL
jgi:decaprenylphospho-beta-D-ribofuranose 2-oxidase